MADRFSTPEIKLASTNVLITNGAQQSLSLLATALIDAGGYIAVANPTYLGALQVFGARSPRFVTVATDQEGLIVEHLEQAFIQGVKFLYTIPDFQNPGGISISHERRRAIVALAHRHDVPILEDVAYRALYYDDPPPPSLLQIEGDYLGAGRWQEKGLVMQLGTASKILMPALRVGWTIAPQAILDKLVLLKQANDLHTSTFNQILVHELARDIASEHITMLRRIYGKRRDAMVAALRRHLPNSVRFTIPKGGMFVWLTLPQGLDAGKLLEIAMSEAKLAFVPGAAFHANGGGENTLRLSFVSNPPGEIEAGMEKLSALIARQVSAPDSS